MRLLFVIIPFLVYCSCSRKSHIEAVVSENHSDISTSLKFPDDWLGYWTGDLYIYKAEGETMTVPMAIENTATDNDSIWTWAIIYGKDTISGRRDYDLHLIDDTLGHYMIDEKNSIYLDAFVLNNSLISTFKVANNYLQSSYELDGDEMIFTVHLFPEKEIRISGDSIINEEKISIVHSYKNSVLQKAILTKRRE